MIEEDELKGMFKYAGGMINGCMFILWGLCAVASVAIIYSLIKLLL